MAAYLTSVLSVLLSIHALPWAHNLLEIPNLQVSVVLSQYKEQSYTHRSEAGDVTTSVTISRKEQSHLSNHRQVRE